jgi:hypothetical protein
MYVCSIEANWATLCIIVLLFYFLFLQLFLQRQLQDDYPTHHLDY